RAKRSRANAEILREIFTVVYMRPPQDKADFGNWLDTLNQGASLEGIYNGLTHSSGYRRLESSIRGASPEALKRFGVELARLQAELPEPTRFREDASLPLPVPVQPEYVKPADDVMEFGSAEERRRKAEKKRVRPDLSR